jgi:integrase
MSSFRTWIRSIKNITDDAELFTEVKKYDPSNTIKTSGVRALQELVMKQIPTLSEKSTIEMYKILNVLIPAVSTDSTVQNVYVQIRKAVKATHGEDSNITKKAYTVLQHDRLKWQQARAQYNEKVIEKNAHKKHFDQAKIYDIMDNLPERDNTDYIDLTICLQLACGGRVSEILSFSKFKSSPKEHHIIQTGVLKSKTRTTVEKPVIRYSVDKFLKLMAQMRTMIKPQLRQIKNGKLTHYEFSQDCNSKINRRISKLMGEKEASHTLRKIYSALAYEQYANKNNVSESSYLSNILGHDLKSLDISKSYSTVSVVDNGDLPEENKVKKEVDPVDMVVPRNLKLRDGKSMIRLKETARILKLKGMPVTNMVLRTYGYSTTNAGLYMANEIK